MLEKVARQSNKIVLLAAGLLPAAVTVMALTIIIIIIIIRYICLLSQAFLPGTSLEPAVIPTAHASSFTLQYFPYYV